MNFHSAFKHTENDSKKVMTISDYKRILYVVWGLSVDKVQSWEKSW